MTDIQSKLSVRNFRGCLAANHAVWCGIFDLPGENQKEGAILRIFGKGRESWEIMDVAARSQPRQAVVKDVLGERVQKMFQDFLEEYVGYLGSYIIASCGRERDFWGVSLSHTHSSLPSQHCEPVFSPPLSLHSASMHVQFQKHLVVASLYLYVQVQKRLSLLSPHSVALL